MSRRKRTTGKDVVDGQGEEASTSTAVISDRTEIDESSRANKRQRRSKASSSDDELDLIGGAQADQPFSHVDGVSNHAAGPSTAYYDQRRCAVLQRLAGHIQSVDELVGLEEQTATLRQTLEPTIRNGEGNSILLVGPRGGGKSAILKASLASIGAPSDYHLVTISARSCSTDRMAMRELARQLIQTGAISLGPHGGQNEANVHSLGLADEDDDGDLDERSQSSDSEEDGDEDDHGGEEDDAKTALGTAVLSSLSSTTSSILSMLASAHESNAKPLIIVLDSFDLLTLRPRQALLYCLLDAVQSGSYRPGLAVVGMTRRPDTTELLEKRVKSRFSHRIVHCYPPATVEQWLAVVEKTLMAGTRNDDSDSEGEGGSPQKTWRSCVNDLTKESAFGKLIQDVTELSKDVQLLYQVLYPPIALLDTERAPTLTASQFIESYRAIRVDATLAALQDLPLLPFLLLIASKHLQTRDRNVFNFETLFDEVTQFAKRSRREREAAGTGDIGLKANSGGANEIDDSLAIEGEVAANRTPTQAQSVAATGAPRSSPASTTEWEDRKRALMAFQQLLALEIFLPDAFLSTLSSVPSAAPTAPSTASSLSSTTGASAVVLPGGSAAATTTATASSGVRKEYLRVRSILDPSTIVEIAKARGKKGTLRTEVVQWAVRGG